MSPIYKQCYKGLLVLLCAIVAIVQIYLMLGEVNNSEEVDGNCKEVQYSRIFEVCMKCSLAFLAGGIISDLRFIKMGFL
jgi:hypothetical protein